MVARSSLFRLAYLLPWLTSAAAFGQIQELATNTDGSQLFFSTPFRLKGTSQFSSFKIFRNVTDGYSLVAQTPPTVSLPNGTLEIDDLHFPNVSGDGSTIAWDEIAKCRFVTANCKPAVPNSLTIRGFAQGIQLPAAMNAGSIRVSRNGRYFLSFCCWITGDPQTLTLYDAVTGDLTPISGFKVADNGLQTVADDGTLVLVRVKDSRTVLWNAGSVRELTVQTGMHETVRMDPTASTLVYQTLNPTTEVVALIAQDLKSGRETQIGAGHAGITGEGFVPIYIGAFFLPSISDDGRRVLLRYSSSNAQPQVYISNSDGSGLRQLTNEAAGIAEVALSGDGHTGYAITNNSALLRIDVDSGETWRLLSDMPVNLGTDNAPVPGSRFTVIGDRLITAAGGSLVSIAGVPAPLISATALRVTLQVPWDLDLNNPLTVITAAPDSPFESAVPIQPTPVAPLILDVRSSDFKTELSNPGAARPGDIIVAAMTGLGPVSVNATTGQPAPIDRLSYLASDFSCNWASLGPAEVLFAGLMPTTIGLYQVNLRVPVSIPAGVEAINFTCTATLAGQSASAQRSVPLTR